MSYSYIKTVFPNFENKSKHQELYNSLNSITFDDNTQSLSFNKVKSENDYIYKDNYTDYPMLSTSGNYNSDSVTFDKELKEDFKNELSPFTKKTTSVPIKPNQFYETPINKSNFSIENFREIDSMSSCNVHYTHLINCVKCK